MADKIALLLVIIGAVNWGLIGVFQFDLVAWLGGGQSGLLSRIIYGLVALAGVWEAPDRAVASRLEYRLQRLSREEKERLCAGETGGNFFAKVSPTLNLCRIWTIIKGGIL